MGPAHGAATEAETDAAVAQLNRILDVYVPIPNAPWPFTVNGDGAKLAVEISDPNWPVATEATVALLRDSENVGPGDVLAGTLPAGTLVSISGELYELAAAFSWADTDPDDPINGIAIMRFVEAFEVRPAQFVKLSLVGRTDLPQRWARLIDETVADTVRSTGAGNNVTVEVVGETVAIWEVNDPLRSIGSDALLVDETGGIWAVQGLTRSPDAPTRAVLTAKRQQAA